nr:uncharacterized protein LOC128691915 [Cherax quadricarinatus]
MFFIYILLLTVGNIVCHPERVIVKLANGGTSRPILVQPFKHNHDHLVQPLEHNHEPPSISTTIDKNLVPVPQALTQGQPHKEENKGKAVEFEKGTNSLQKIVNDSDTAPHNTDVDRKGAQEKYLQNHTQKSVVTSQRGSANDKVYSEHTTHSVTIAEVNSFYIDINGEDNLREGRDIDENIEVLSIKMITPQTTVKSTKEILTTEIPHTPKIPLEQTSTPQSTRDAGVSPSMAPPELPCHESCIAALNKTILYGDTSLVLSQGSDLTLVCELPLNVSLYRENLIWLFHPNNSPEGQCSLTTQEFLPSCYGFQSIKNTDDRNATFLRETITLSNIQTNHTGQYMCQVQLTCCLNSKEHTMSQERILYVRVWISNYILDLAVTGTVAAALLLLVVAVTYYLTQRQHDDYAIVEDMRDIKPSTVLHMPLIDDQDNDSFDSNFDE